MAFDKDSLDGYVEVNERIIEFKELFPDGSLQSEIVQHVVGNWMTVELTDKYGKPYEARRRTDGLIAVKAYAYRTPEDPRPGIGHSWIEIPGSTPYTRTSELENAETSAWGRALAAIGIKVKRSIATKDEIANKQDDGGNGSPKKEDKGGTARKQSNDESKTLTPAQADAMVALLTHAMNAQQPVDRWIRAWGIGPVEGLAELGRDGQVNLAMYGEVMKLSAVAAEVLFEKGKLRQESSKELVWPE